MKKLLMWICVGAGMLSSCKQPSPKTLFSSVAYSVYADSVVQPPFRAIAISDSGLFSDYRSLNTGPVSSLIRFKFSLNSRDNEMPSGTDHFITLQPDNGAVKSPPVIFGHQYLDTANIPVTKLPFDTRWTVQLDLRPMFRAFKTQGFYTLFNGQKVYPSDFKGVYIAGGTAPLMWDFENLCNNPALKLTDENKDSIYEVTLLLNPRPGSKKPSTWKLSADLSEYPQFHSGYTLINALYNLSLEELIKDIRPDSTFMAGAMWNGVWTRDISYSILLSLAAVNPEIAKYSLLRKVKNKKIIQDTGTGGSWPVSTDRMTWALAAWEIYKVTGDTSWLGKAYTIIKNSTDDDLMVAYDPKTGLMHGESSFLDWREQTYPKWFEPVDIFESENLGTNAVHYQTWLVLSEMAKILGKPHATADSVAATIKSGINRYLWMPSKGYYGQYHDSKYGSTLSTRSEALGEALCVLFNIASSDRQKDIVAHTPVTAFGIPCIFPEIPGIQPYHNNAVWPFVEAFWTLASAKAGNETSVKHGLGAIYRQAALFLTNKENMVAENGDDKGTAINSDRQLWSVAGNLAMVYKLYFGMDFQPSGIDFHPFVPASYSGLMELANFTYRKMHLKISLRGSGNKISKFILDGKVAEKPFVPGNLTGEHSVVIELSGESLPVSTINMQKVRFEPFPDSMMNRQPIVVDVLQAEKFAPASGLKYQGFHGRGFVELSRQKNTSVTFMVTMNQPGEYVIDFRYSNGSGPVNTDNKCAVRTLRVEGSVVGAAIFPQRGKGEWSNWGYSNVLPVHLEKGVNKLSLTFDAWDENMNGDVNTAMLDEIRILKVKP